MSTICFYLDAIHLFSFGSHPFIFIWMPLICFYLDVTHSFLFGCHPFIFIWMPPIHFYLDVTHWFLIKCEHLFMLGFIHLFLFCCHLFVFSWISPTVSIDDTLFLFKLWQAKLIGFTSTYNCIFLKETLTHFKFLPYRFQSAVFSPSFSCA